MRTKYKPWAKPFLDEHKELCPSDEELLNMKNIYLEIGSGKGLFITNLAKKNPSINYLAIERNVTCAGFTAKKIVEQEISNVKLIQDDAMKVLEKLGEKSVKIMYLNFSDPWPKIRHHKRRLTSERFLSLYKKVLAKDGLIVQKTDNLDLFTFSLETFSNNGFTVIDKDENYALNENEDELTEYEIDFRKENLPIYRLKVKYE